jgi:hypothetical protein
VYWLRGRRGQAYRPRRRAATFEAHCRLSLAASDALRDEGLSMMSARFGALA